MIGYHSLHSTWVLSLVGVLRYRSSESGDLVWLLTFYSEKKMSRDILPTDPDVCVCSYAIGELEFV